MRIINGLKDGGTVVSLLELEDLVELTSEGFRPMQLSTLEAIAARVRGNEAQRSSVFAELEFALPPRRRHRQRTMRAMTDLDGDA